MRGRGKNNPLKKAAPRAAGTLRSDAKTVSMVSPEKLFNQLHKKVSWQTMREWMQQDLEGKKDLIVAWDKAYRYDMQLRMLMVLPEERTKERLSYWLTPYFMELEKVATQLEDKRFVALHKQLLNGYEVGNGDWKSNCELEGMAQSLKTDYGFYSDKNSQKMDKDTFTKHSFLATAYDELINGNGHTPYWDNEYWLLKDEPITTNNLERLAQRIWSSMHRLELALDDENSKDKLDLRLAKKLANDYPNPFESKIQG